MLENTSSRCVHAWSWGSAFVHSGWHDLFHNLWNESISDLLHCALLDALLRDAFHDIDDLFEKCPRI